jgi:transposase InsO family protein
MTEELKEIGLNVGHRRVGRLMRQNGISVVRTRKHKATADSNHKFNIAPNLLDRNFAADAPTRNGPVTLPTFGRVKVGCIWPWCWNCIRGALSPSHGLHGQTTVRL